MTGDKHISRRSFIKAAGAIVGVSALGYLLARKAGTGIPPVAVAATNTPAAAANTALINPPQLATATGSVGGGVTSAYVLPRNLLTAPGSVFEDFENFAGWTGRGSGSISANTSEFRTGTKSLKIIAPAGGAIQMATKTINYAPGGAAPKRLRVFYYCHNADPFNDNLYIRLYLSSTATIANQNFFAAKVTHIVPGWNVWDIFAGDWNMTGAESWNNTMIRLRFSLGSKSAANDFSISLDEIRLNPTYSPSVMITFVDRYDTIPTLALPVMQAARLRATYYVISDWVNQGGKFVSSQHLLDMAAAGWDVANHGQTIDLLNTLTQAQTRDNLLACKAFLDGLGLTKASMHYSYMNSAMTNTALAGIIEAGMLTAALTDTPTPSCLPEQNYVWGQSGLLNNGLSLAAAKALVDLAISDGRICVFEGFKMGDTADSMTWVTSDFQELITYIKSKDLPCLTISDYYAAQAGPITVEK